MNKKIIIGVIISMLIIFSPFVKAEDSNIKVECNCKWYDWEYEPNFRTLIVIDVVVNENLNELQQADYRPEKDTSWIRDFAFSEMMDLQAYKGFNEGSGLPREHVLKVGDEKDDYALKLQRLIDANVMTRDSFYYLTRNGSGISISDKRYWEEQD